MKGQSMKKRRTQFFFSENDTRIELGVSLKPPVVELCITQGEAMIYADMSQAETLRLSDQLYRAACVLGVKYGR